MVYSNSPLIIRKLENSVVDIECLRLEVLLSVLQHTQKPAFQLQRLPGLAGVEGRGLHDFYFLFWNTVLNSIGYS